MRYRTLLLLFFLLFAGLSLAASNTLTAEEAKNHIGETATVCGVASVHYAATTRGNPTFVNLDKPYPDQPFTILIWGEDLAKFKPGPISWNGKRVCATGMITSYRGKPEIVAKTPGQVTVEERKQFARH